jgi:ATP-dependent Lon protease
MTRFPVGPPWLAVSQVADQKYFGRPNTRLFTQKNMKKAAYLIFTLSTISSFASGQTLSYDNEQQLMGAAAFSPTSTYQILQKLVAKCGSYNPTLNHAGGVELQRWEQRHHAYLDENAKIRTQLEKMYTHPDAKKAYHDMQEKTLPEAVQKQYEAYASPIDMMPRQAQKEQMCQSYLKAIGEKKFDLKNNDPAVTAYLDKRIH